MKGSNVNTHRRVRSPYARVMPIGVVLADLAVGLGFLAWGRDSLLASVVAFICWATVLGLPRPLARRYRDCPRHDLSARGPADPGTILAVGAVVGGSIAVAASIVSLARE